MGVGSADSPTTSPTLLAALSGPDAGAAWAAFVDRYRPYIEAAGLAAGLTPADADEVCADVLAGLVTALRDFRYDPARRFRGYLRRAVTNAAAKHWRAAGRRAAPADPRDLDRVALPGPIAGLADTLERDIAADLRRAERAVETVRGRVDPVTWRAFWETAVGGRPAAAVAADLGKSVAAVYVAKSRVAKLLREAVGPSAAG